jgi:hypothetical protein
LPGESISLMSAQRDRALRLLVERDGRAHVLAVDDDLDRAGALGWARSLS